MEGYYSTGQSPQQAAVPVEEEEEEEEDEEKEEEEEEEEEEVEVEEEEEEEGFSLRSCGLPLAHSSLLVSNAHFLTLFSNTFHQVHHKIVL
jgi:CO dehydrogenase/acetyl-CoA synthase beta subunit